MKYFYGIFGCGELYHISIRRLQISLLKIALVLGIEVYTGVEFEGIIQPENGRSWRAVCKPLNHVVSNFEFDVLISATGARDALAAFDRKELRGRLAIAITANFVNSNTKEEIKAEEVGGVASHFRQDFFRELKRKTKIDLENIVYYKDETHYFVMTAKKSSLLERGVFKSDFSDAQDLMSKSNIHVPALLSYARDAANFCTKNVMPNLKFALNQYGKEDVSMLDFSSNDIKSIKRYNARSNMSFIVELAQREFGISPTMTVAEMLLCSSLNEMSMVAYLRQFYDQFADEQASTKADDTPLSPAVASIFPPKPNLPRRPDFLSRRVTSASRRIEFYNAADEPEPEEKAEDKVFEHNFGASIRKGIGAFTIRRIKQMATKEPEEPSSSSEDESTDEDDEVKEAIEDKFGANVDKNMTIKDAKSFLEAFRAEM
ncbi:hypothetical protein FSP39_005696 [Pinctada imbricata]|uniref:[F-actin]-monooxygenase MICAL1-3-like Rossman domain-containing protein n=1 Tax=Pinctada imbricata TaxID=66713 RepID=A0AA88XZ90_PINIB|nr:hypothetical protein FSP39_005696 [Pinctada imbricata]